jgi:hypothetical protein
MSQLPQNLPLSRDQVLDEVEFLLTVEHALIVEYLSVRCALGYDLDTAHGGPVTEASREAAAEPTPPPPGRMRCSQTIAGNFGSGWAAAFGPAAEHGDLPLRPGAITRH